MTTEQCMATHIRVGIRLTLAITVHNIVLNCLDIVGTDGWTDGRTDGRTDGQTHPLIEMRERI